MSATPLPPQPICSPRARLSPPSTPSPPLLYLSLRPTTASTNPWRGSSQWRTSAFPSGEQHELSFDSLLSVAEVLCGAPPAVYSIGCIIGSVIPINYRLFHVQLGNKVLVVQFLLLAAAVVVGGLIRRRQWRRICGAGVDGSRVGLVGRIEKAEEEVRSSATIVRALSRQLEKLGTRFRVTRKALKDPIAETAALAQKNSAVTRALAMQEDNLEKELGEIQKVLLAMQEQQQKQLELILAIGKAAGLLENRQDARTKHVAVSNNSIPEKEEANPLGI